MRGKHVSRASQTVYPHQPKNPFPWKMLTVSKEKIKPHLTQNRSSGKEALRESYFSATRRLIFCMWQQGCHRGTVAAVRQEGRLWSRQKPPRAAGRGCLPAAGSTRRQQRWAWGWQEHRRAAGGRGYGAGTWRNCCQPCKPLSVLWEIKGRGHLILNTVSRTAWTDRVEHLASVSVSVVCVSCLLHEYP